MRTLQLLPVLGLVGSVAAIGATYEGPARVERPRVHATIFTRDTIYFCARGYPSQHRTAYAFLRASRQWRSLGQAGRCARARDTFQWWDDSVFVLGRGVRVEKVRVPSDSRFSRSYLRLTDSARRQTIDLKPVLSAERVKALETMGFVQEDTVSVGVAGHAMNDSLVWIGLAGGFPEGEGNFGGIYRVDRRKGTYDYYVDSTLSWHTVTGLAQAAGYLWVGTQQPGEYGSFGNAGLIRRNLRTGAWSSVRDATLPDALIEAVGADARSVAIATEFGIAVGEFAPSRPGRERAIAKWNVRHFVPAFSGDSLVFRLGPKPSARVSDSIKAHLVFAQSFAGPGRERPIMDALRKSGVATVRDARSNGSIELSWFGDLMSVPVIESFLGGGLPSLQTAATALDGMGDGAPAKLQPRIRKSFVAIDTVTEELPAWSEVRVNLGRTLNRLGDSTASRWAMGALARAERTAPEDPTARARRELDIKAANAILAVPVRRAASR